MYIQRIQHVHSKNTICTFKEYNTTLIEYNRHIQIYQLASNYLTQLRIDYELGSACM